MLEYIAIGGGMIVAYLVLRARRSRAVTDDAARFTLRLTAAKTTRLGTSVEVSELPSHEPVLASEEVAFDDDAFHVVEIPRGTELSVRAFTGAVRAPLEVVTTAAGSARRYSFEIPAGTRFWVLDAPGWQECLGTTEPSRRRLPPRAGGYEVTTRLPPEPAVDTDGTISVTIADMTLPLWMHGMEDPSDWLLGARSRRTAVAIAAFDDPFRRTRAGTGAVGSVHFQLLDAIWLETTARPEAGTPIALERARVFTPESLRTWESMRNWWRQWDDDAIIVWGVAHADLEADGFDARLRTRGNPAEVTLGGPLPVLRRELVATLERRGIARVSPDAGICARITPLPEEVDGAYAAICDLMFLIVMAHPNNGALPVQTPEMQQRVVELARELAELVPASEVAVLTWIAAAIYAHDEGGLLAAQRTAVLDLVRARTRADDPIVRLAPAIWYRLGERGEAAAACRAALVWCDETADAYRGTLDEVAAAYRTWLDKLQSKL